MCATRPIITILNPVAFAFKTKPFFEVIELHPCECFFWLGDVLRKLYPKGFIAPAIFGAGTSRAVVILGVNAPRVLSDIESAITVLSVSLLQLNPVDRIKARWSMLRVARGDDFHGLDVAEA